MIEALLSTLTGPLGGLLAGIAAVVAALVLGRHQGASGEREKRAARDAADYTNERKRIDDEIGTAGATDRQRIEQLHQIANRRGGAGKD